LQELERNLPDVITLGKALDGGFRQFLLGLTRPRAVSRIFCREYPLSKQRQCQDTLPPHAACRLFRFRPETYRDCRDSNSKRRCQDVHWNRRHSVC